MSAPRFPLRAAAALFLERQWLDKPRGRRLSARTLEGFAAATGGVQLDSINVIDRAHHLTLWNRFGPYRREALRRLVEKRRVLFEYWAHAACLIAISDFPAWRRVMLENRTRRVRWPGFLKRPGALIQDIENAIRERGPLGNSDFREPGGRKRGGWWDWKPATHALDWLWITGQTAVDSRVHFQKRFDLIERALGAALEREPVPLEEFGRWHVRKSLAAMGAATERDLAAYLIYPRWNLRDRRAAMRRMVKSGEVVEISLEGDHGRWFALHEDLDALASAGRRRAPSAGSAMLAPFDSFLWHRERTKRLFGYDYRIEVYVPGPKRTYGYYSLPLLVDGQLIGRADVKTHRAESVLELKNVHFEPWFAKGQPPPVAGWRPLDRDHALAAVADAAVSLAAFVGCARVKLTRAVPGAIQAPLRRSIATLLSSADRRKVEAPDMEPEETGAPA